MNSGSNMDIIFILLLIIVILSLCMSIILYGKHKKPMEIKGIVDFFRGIWGYFIIYVLATGIIALFVIGNSSQSGITLQVMNEWVSLVLGLAALFIGIISLFLSFYNLDQSVETQETLIQRVNETNKNIENDIKFLKDDIVRILETLPDKTAKEVVLKQKEYFENNTDVNSFSTAKLDDWED